MEKQLPLTQSNPLQRCTVWARPVSILDSWGSKHSWPIKVSGTSQTEWRVFTIKSVTILIRHYLLQSLLMFLKFFFYLNFLDVVYTPTIWIEMTLPANPLKCVLISTDSRLLYEHLSSFKKLRVIELLLSKGYKDWPNNIFKHCIVMIVRKWDHSIEKRGESEHFNEKAVQFCANRNKNNKKICLKKKRITITEIANA